MSRIITGDAFDELRDLDANSVHAVVTDPPYALGDSGFMGRDWDNFSDSKTYQKWCEKWAEKCLRVLKPGGHLLAFGGNTRHHRLNVGVEDAGFEIRDQLTYHFGSGFPKALDVSKAIDKAAGAEREVVGEHPRPAGNEPGGNALHMSERGMPDTTNITEPATDAAREWDGFKTALKPATEFIVLARKPFSGTVAENVQAHGTGALNIDGCRIGTDGGTRSVGKGEDSERAYGDGLNKTGVESIEAGRYPANVIFDADAAEALDREVGELGGGPRRTNDEVESSGEGVHEGYQRPNASMFTDDEPGGIRQFGDTGGPSRYFYTSKATRAERTLGGRIENAHPTVKPVDLMEWLVTLVTAEDQTVLDPFCGTGTTCLAAKNLCREFVGIEQNQKWADVARARCGLDVRDPSVLVGDEQETLDV